MSKACESKTFSDIANPDIIFIMEISASKINMRMLCFGLRYKISSIIATIVVIGKRRPCYHCRIISTFEIT